MRAIVRSLILTASLAWLALPAPRLHSAPDNLAACDLILDAGSSNLRAHAFTVSADGLPVAIFAEPPKMKGFQLADMLLADHDESLASFEALRTFLESEVMPEFRKKCAPHPRSARVYATAGMRLAERKLMHAAKTDDAVAVRNKIALFRTGLDVKLTEVLGTDVDTRTLTGFEEGLFSYLSVLQRRRQSGYPREAAVRFGIVELGGASAQIAYGCLTRQCRRKGRPVPEYAKTIRLNAENATDTIYVYARSFLGLGINEAWESYAAACELKAEDPQSEQRYELCAQAVAEKLPAPMRFPAELNPEYTPFYGISTINYYTKEAPGPEHLQSAAANICSLKYTAKDFEKNPFLPRVCMLHLYFARFLEEGGIRAVSAADASAWANGAAWCGRSDCLRDVRDLAKLCEWMPEGACAQPE